MNKQKNTKREPKHRITNPEFKYTPSDKTDILKTFTLMGWEPPSHARNERDWEHVRKVNGNSASG